MKQSSIIEKSIPYIIMNPTASVLDIAQNAGISRATFHRTFSGRDELFEAITWQCIADLEEALKRIDVSMDDAIVFRSMLEVLIDLGDRIYFLYYFPGSIVKEEQKKEAQRILKPVYDGCRRVQVNAFVPINWIMNSVSLMTAMAWMQIELGSTQRHDAVNYTFSMLLKGI